MPRSSLRWLLAPLAMAALMLTACTPATLQRVVLLPETPPRSTAVEVRSGEQALVLDSPYAVAVLRVDQPLVAETTTPEAVAKIYPRLVGQANAQPSRFVLNFEPGSSQLTPESRAQLPSVIAQARRISGGEIIVIGHTDRQGSAEANDRLSLVRAQAVRELLVQQGFDAELIEAVGRGEREPLVQTDDEVVEPRNRRAEILVR